MSGKSVCSCQWDGCDEVLTPQGIKSHQTHCDHNPNPGVPYAQQKDLGILEMEAEPEHPTPDQSGSSSGGLPSVSTLEPNKNPEVEASTDGGTGQHEPNECPICGHGSVTNAQTAKAEYLEDADGANGRVVLALELADWMCDDMECAGVWGAKYNEPLTMQEVLAA